MRRAPRDSEEAISQVVAMTVFLFLAVVISGSAYAWIRAIEPPEQTSPHALTFAMGTTVVEPDGMRKNFTVQLGSIGTRWWNVEVRLDGERLACAAEHGATDGWRLWWQGQVMPCNGPRGAPDERVAAGQTFEIWDSGATATLPLAGRQLEFLDPDANAIVQRVRIV